MPTIRVAHSPDSDDAFMFWALASGKIDTGDRTYVHELSDIESLNRRAMAGELEVTAVSIHAYAYLHDRYALLPHGASMGDGYGPRLVGRAPAPGDPQPRLADMTVAIPGDRTTAALALRLYQPAVRTVAMAFDAIEDAVASGEVPIGLLIHEGQLTYGDRGLHLWEDLGAWWKVRTGLPLPLGGNVVRKDLGPDMIRTISRDLRASIVLGLEQRTTALAHAQQYARGLAPDRTDTFVGMYVNDWTVDYGAKGRDAVQRLLDEGANAGIIPAVKAEFVAD